MIKMDLGMETNIRIHVWEREKKQRKGYKQNKWNSRDNKLDEANARYLKKELLMLD